MKKGYTQYLFFNYTDYIKHQRKKLNTQLNDKKYIIISLSNDDLKPLERQEQLGDIKGSFDKNNFSKTSLLKSFSKLKKWSQFLNSIH